MKSWNVGWLVVAHNSADNVAEGAMGNPLMTVPKTPFEFKPPFEGDHEGMDIADAERNLSDKGKELMELVLMIALFLVFIGAAVVLIYFQDAIARSSAYFWVSLSASFSFMGFMFLLGRWSALS